MTTQIDKREPLYQVWATETATNNLVAVPMFPRAMKEAAEMWVSDMERMIREGKEKRYADPKALPHLGMLNS